MYYPDAQQPSSEYDQALLWSVLLLLAFGLLMVYSSSIASAGASRQTGFQETYYPAAPGRLSGGRSDRRRHRLSSAAARLGKKCRRGCFWPALPCWPWC